MAMQINGTHESSRTDYAEWVKEKQAAENAQKAKEARRETEAKGTSKLSGLQDEYISSEKSGKKPTGLYRIGQDENGNRKIFFDDLNKANRAEKKEEPKADKDASREGTDGKKPKVDRNNQEKPEKCVGNTNAVEREIRKLKEKKQEIEQQIRSASGDEKKLRELEKKLAQVEQELSQKDNNTYRRQHTVFSRMA